MALSYTAYTGNGTLKDYPISFAYIEKAHIKVTVEGQAVPFTVDTANKVVRLSTAPAVGERILVYRETPITKTYSDFSRGNAFGQSNVNYSFLWQLMISQELSEGRRAISHVMTEDLNMGLNKIINLAAGTNPNDAVNFSQIDGLEDKVLEAEKNAVDAAKTATDASVYVHSLYSEFLEYYQGAGPSFPTDNIVNGTLFYYTGGQKERGLYVNFFGPDGLANWELISEEGPQGPQGPTGAEGPIGATGATGATGPVGPQGPVGATPNSEWQGSKLRFQQGDGSWGNFSDLLGPQGPQGLRGPQGVIGPIPSHEWNGKEIRFQMGDGSMGPWTDVSGPQGATGPTGPQGNIGPSPEHRWSSTSLQFKQPNGTWGAVVDLKGEQGLQGIQGIQGPVGLTGPQGDSFSVDEHGTLAERSKYDGEAKGFTYYATDYEVKADSPARYSRFVSDGSNHDYKITFTPDGQQSLIVLLNGVQVGPDNYDWIISGDDYTLRFKTPLSQNQVILVREVTLSTGYGAIYIKNSSTSGDWSDAIPFGKGPRGDQGERGPQGIQGPQGPIGATGAEGPQGPRGETGLTGSQGPQGEQGLRGPAGPVGEQGPRGIQGPEGLQGPQGERGPQGEKGVQGDKGLDGAQGPRGETGARGPQGAQGIQGIDGVQGPRGDRGPMGSTGPTGPKGPAGPAGPKGPTGDKGADGHDGANGKSARGYALPPKVISRVNTGSYDGNKVTVVLEEPSVISVLSDITVLARTNAPEGSKIMGQTFCYGFSVSGQFLGGVKPVGFGSSVYPIGGSSCFSSGVLPAGTYTLGVGVTISYGPSGNVMDVQFSSGTIIVAPV